MQRKYSSYRLPGDLEELSDFSNQDLRLAPEYAEVKEAYRKIKSFEEAVEILDDSNINYNQSAKAAANIWPEAYEAFNSIDEPLEDIHEKFHAERVMNSGFEDFNEELGEVNTRYRELERTVEDARETYREAAGVLGNEIQNAIFRGQDTPLDYALEESDSEAFDRRAERLQKRFFRPRENREDLLNLLTNQV